jgi:hypothetical protein
LGEVLIAGCVLSGVFPLPGLQVRSNCGTSTILPSYARRASWTFCEFTLPVAVTYCHDGSGTAGLVGFEIWVTSSLVPPDGGVQSSQPTLPGPFWQSGIL